MKLELKAKHFEGTIFALCRSCAISKAYLDLTGNVGAEYLTFIQDQKTRVCYDHDHYDYDDFGSDKLKAESHNWDDTVVRTIELIES